MEPSSGRGRRVRHFGEARVQGIQEQGTYACAQDRSPPRPIAHKGDTKSAEASAAQAWEIKMRA